MVRMVGGGGVVGSLSSRSGERSRNYFFSWALSQGASSCALVLLVVWHTQRSPISTATFSQTKDQGSVVLSLGFSELTPFLYVM